jgi:hypothetical protein
MDAIQVPSNVPLALTLSAAEIQAVLDGLAELPYKRSQAVFANIISQIVASQMSPLPPGAPPPRELLSMPQVPADQQPPRDPVYAPLDNAPIVATT